MLTPKIIARMLDHSTLQPFLTNDDIRNGCEVALKYGTASVCARPGDMALVHEMLRGSGVRTCTVIGFPHGANRSDVKLFEAQKALDDGCEELDMVLHIGALKAGELDYVTQDIRQIVEAAKQKSAIVKVILETAYLDTDQKIAACRCAEEAGAAFVKTSTGYAPKGATVEDLVLMRENTGPSVRVKASGGIRNLDSVLAARAAGAARCGVSATQKIMEEANRRYAMGTLEEQDVPGTIGEEGY